MEFKLLSCGTVYCSVQGGSIFGICRVKTLSVPRKMEAIVQDLKYLPLLFLFRML